MDITSAIKKFRKFYLKQKRMPTYEEIRQLFNFSSKNASYYLVQKLIKEEILDKDKKGKILPKKLFHIPHFGVIQAGHPSSVEGSVLNNIDFYQYILNMPNEIFSLTVRGDSMIEEGIRDGDIVIVEKNREPHLGDIVAAFVDNEWTIKFFKKIDNKICLVPANSNYPTIYPRENLLIGGVVVSVIRKYY